MIEFMLATIITLVVILLDVLSKYLVVQILLPLGKDVTVIPYIIDFSYVENRGAAFGMLADNRWVFMLISALMIIALICLLRFSNVKHRLFTVSIAFILGGGMGNMIDRIFIGYVVDFIKVTFVEFAVFNIADSFVVIGAILMAVYLVFYDKELLKSKSDGAQK